MKMEPIRSSETSAIKTQTPGNYPKRNILQCMLIDVAISGDKNVIKNEAEKILKYKDLTI